VHQAPAPETFGCAVYRHKTTFPLVCGVDNNFITLPQTVIGAKIKQSCLHNIKPLNI